MNYRDGWTLEKYQEDVKQKTEFLESELADLELEVAKLNVQAMRVNRNVRYVNGSRKDVDEALEALEKFKSIVPED